MKIESLITDCHCQIKKYMREEEEDIGRQFDDIFSNQSR